MSVELNRQLPSYTNSLISRNGTASIRQNDLPIPSVLDGEEEVNPLLLGPAIKAYKEEVLSGGNTITDEERKEIEKAIEEYVKNNKLKTDHSKKKLIDEDQQKLLDFINTLYKKYGYKDDFFEFAEVITGKVLEDQGYKLDPPLEMQPPVEFYKKQALKTPNLLPFQALSAQQLKFFGEEPGGEAEEKKDGTVKNEGAKEEEREETETQMFINPAGERILAIKGPFGVRYMKVGENLDPLDDSNTAGNMAETMDQAYVGAFESISQF